ncbi:MAG TPA: glycosyltransferase [Patescibacteria group bacterium]
MRIGIYDPYLDDIGGGEKYMMTIAQILSKENKVDVFWNNDRDFEVISKRFGIDFTKIKRVDNIFVPSVGLVQRLLATKPYDVLILLSDGSIPLVASRKLLLHIQQPLFNSQATSLWGKIKLSRVNKIFCNAFFTKNFVDKALGRDTEVIYPPVAIKAQHLTKQNIILHVGRFRVKNVAIGDYKKQSIMVDTFKKMIDNELKDWKFVLAVSIQEKDKESFEKMKESAKGYPIEFFVNKTNDELWELYSKAKIYWHASGYGENLNVHPEYAEHFGISTVEAMGAGCVPVVINAGGQKEIVTDKKNGFLWSSLEELQKLTESLIKSPNTLKSISEKSKERAKDFGPDVFEEKIMQLIK